MDGRTERGGWGGEEGFSKFQELDLATHHRRTFLKVNLVTVFGTSLNEGTS